MTKNEILANIKVRTQEIRTLNSLVLKLRRLQDEFKKTEECEIVGFTIGDLVTIETEINEKRRKLAFERADLNRTLDKPLMEF